MKKVVIVRAAGNELANQLWNYMSIYAYCLERDIPLENPSFFEYGNYFTIPAPNLFLRLFFFAPFTDYTKRKSAFKRRLWRRLYSYCVRAVLTHHKKAVLISDNMENKPYYLPPTSENPQLLALEHSADTLYFDGWLFRNPVGLTKYHKNILKYFKPRTDIMQAVQARIKALRDEFPHLVGVHIRQGDYQTWRGGAYFVPQRRVREILDEYLTQTGHTAKETCFVITSDGPVDTSLFTGLPTFVSKENLVHDLFLLASTDAIIGSNSTFGAFASYYGNTPFIVMQNGPVDWTYYADKTKYFENTYSTFVHY